MLSEEDAPVTVDADRVESRGFEAPAEISAKFTIANPAKKTNGFARRPPMLHNSNMKRLTPEYLYPIGLLTLVLIASAYLSYGVVEGPWYKVVYLDQRDAFSAATKHVDAIADNDTMGATVYVKNKKQADALRHSGAILLDPQGIPSCLSQYSAMKMQPYRAFKPAP